MKFSSEYVSLFLLPEKHNKVREYGVFETAGIVHVCCGGNAQASELIKLWSFADPLPRPDRGN